MVTTDMISEFLGCPILLRPKRAGIRFSHIVFVSKGLRPKVPHGDSKILYCGTPADCIQYLASNPKSYALCLSETQKVPNVGSSVLGRIILLKSSEGIHEVYEKLEGYFITISDWVRSMKIDLLNGGGYQSLLNCSESILKNFIDVSNSEFTLLAWTKNIPIDDKVSQELIAHGKHSSSTVNHFRQLHVTRDWDQQEGTSLKPASPITKYQVLDYLFKVQGNYFIHVKMHCNVAPPTQGLTDTFQLLIDHMHYFVKRDWDEYFPSSSEGSKFFEDLIERHPQSDQQLSERMEGLGLKDKQPYVLLVISFSEDTGDKALDAYHIRHIKDLLPYGLVGMRARTVLVLIPKCEAPSELLPLLRPFRNSNNCSMGLSNPFKDISDFPFAYEQARQALAIGRSPKRSLALRLGETAEEPIYLFSDYFQNYVIESAKANDELVEFSVENGIVARIARFDEEHGTNDLQILYQYLECERRANLSSEILFMHRNTLLYRIKRMQERFEFDLEDPKMRKQIVFEFLICS